MAASIGNSSSPASPALQELKDNPKEEFLAAAEVLLKFANNVLEHPNEKKFRRIRVANPNVQSKLLSVSGGMECLFEMGFEEADDGECLILPETASLTHIKVMRDEIQKLRGNFEPGVTQTSPAAGSLRPSVVPAAPSVPAAQATQSDFKATEAEFYQRLQSASSRVLQYENPLAKSKARAAIPVQQLQTEAQKKFESTPRASTSATSQPPSAPPLDVRDYLLLGLLQWFKHSFFHWVDPVKCSLCGGSTVNAGSASPSYEDLAFGASRVEAHRCTACRHITRFPRYTNAEKLLETRTGRCGEWADCFTLCCRALDFEARYVLDWTDHVWTEVYSVSQGRWLHCDPCENICDKPLLYESGWGKKLTYVIAVAKDDIQDVSWRYSAKHQEMLERRKLCRETWLRQVIHKLWRQKLATLPAPRQKELELRLIAELSEFLCCKRETGEALPGRTTGSLAWRASRGELGAQGGQAAIKEFVFKPTKAEIEAELIHVCYSCAQDAYTRVTNDKEKTQGWAKCVHSSCNIARKEEMDWKKAYLARTERSETAEITWKFDLSDTDLRVSKLEVRAESAIFESGDVSWRLCAGDNCFSHRSSALQSKMTFDLDRASVVTLTAVLRGGHGDVAWQHTQLFRQDLEDTTHFPFEVKCFLN